MSIKPFTVTTAKALKDEIIIGAGFLDGLFSSMYQQDGHPGTMDTMIPEGVRGMAGQRTNLPQHPYKLHMSLLVDAANALLDARANGKGVPLAKREFNTELGTFRDYVNNQVVDPLNYQELVLDVATVITTLANSDKHLGYQDVMDKLTQHKGDGPAP